MAGMAGMRGRAAGAVIVVATICLAMTACVPTPLPGPLFARASGLGNQLVSGGRLSGVCPEAQPVDAAPCGPQPMVWLSIGAPYAAYEAGDPFATKCPPGHPGPFDATGCDDPASPNGSKNPFYRKTGHRFLVDVAPQDRGKPLKLEVYGEDAYTRRLDTPASLNIVCFRDRAPFNAAPYTVEGAWHPSFGPASCQTGEDGGGIGTKWSVTDPAAAAPPQRSSCQLLITYVTDAGPNRWRDLCSWTSAPAQAMVWVQSSDLYDQFLHRFDDYGTGRNNFAMRLTGGTASTITAVDEVSLTLNGPGPVTRTAVAPVGPEHAGRWLHLNVFNPGTLGGTDVHTVRLKGPPGGGGAVIASAGTSLPAAGLATDCQVNPTAGIGPNPPGKVAAPSCEVVVQQADGTRPYAGRWLRFAVLLDESYNCGAPVGTTPADCWWVLENDAGTDLFSVGRQAYLVGTMDP